MSTGETRTDKTRRSPRRRLLMMARGGLALLAFGCGAPPQLLFSVNSYPPGATIYVDDVERGVTPEERLAVTFGSGGAAEVRVEKQGHQPAGAVLTPTSPAKVSFVLPLAPRDEDVLDKLIELSRKAEETNRVLGQIRKAIEDLGQRP